MARKNSAVILSFFQDQITYFDRNALGIKNVLDIAVMTQMQVPHNINKVKKYRK